LKGDGDWLLVAEAVQKLQAKRGVDNDDLVERAVCDLFGVRRGFDIPENA
jgi:hypothetical protein